MTPDPARETAVRRKRRRLPNYIGGTWREFKRRKRKEYRDMMRAAAIYALACAHTPNQAYLEFQQARLSLIRLGHRLMEREWR